MKQWCVLFGKEILEMQRNLKGLWVPVVFILFGVMQPVTYYFMPQILQSAGGLPEGAIIEIPLPKAAEVMAETVGQFGTIGVIVLVLAVMGVVAGERQSRTAAMVMVRPVPYVSFITAKWAAVCLLAVVSVFAGSVAGWYYTVELIGEMSLGLSLSGVAVFCIWIVLIMSITVFFSTIFRSGGAVASLTLLVVLGLSVLSSLLDRFLFWSPSKVSGQAAAILVNGVPGERFGLQTAAAAVAAVVLIAAATWIFKRQEQGD